MYELVEGKPVSLPQPPVPGLTAVSLLDYAFRWRGVLSECLLPRLPALFSLIPGRVCFAHGECRAEGDPFPPTTRDVCQNTGLRAVRPAS